MNKLSTNMRTDIKFDNGSFELSTSSSIPQYTVDWEWVGEDDHYRYGRVKLPYSSGLRNVATGIGVRIPFLPSIKIAMVEILLSGIEGEESVMNKRNNGLYFPLLDVYGKEIRVSRLPFYSTDGLYRLTLLDNTAYLSDYSSMDLMMTESLEQNKRFLLECVPGNLYQYPTTGVGIFRYLNSNLQHSGLAERIKSQFNADKMTVREALINNENNSISILAEE